MPPPNAKREDPGAGSVVVARSRRGLLGGGASLLVGVAICLLDVPDLGLWLVVGGFAFMVVELHRIGRAGPKRTLA
ncbi:MAG: hypothetical protein QM784_36225 [Polyangiaceae bacterium]